MKTPSVWARQRTLGVKARRRNRWHERDQVVVVVLAPGTEVLLFHMGDLPRLSSVTPVAWNGSEEFDDESLKVFFAAKVHREADDVAMKLFASGSCDEPIVGNGRSDARHFVSREAHADPMSAHQDADVAFPIGHRIADPRGNLRIIDLFPVGTTEIAYFMPQPLEDGTNSGFGAGTTVIASGGDLHQILHRLGQSNEVISCRTSGNQA